jgi:hypothetical protein
MDSEGAAAGRRRRRALRLTGLHKIWVYEGSPIHRLADTDLTDASTRYDFPVRRDSVTIAFSHYSWEGAYHPPCPEAARRVALVLAEMGRCRPGVRLARLRLHHHRDDSGSPKAEEEDGRLRDAVDAFLGGMAAAAESTVRFDCLQLNFFGWSDGPWRRFAGRYGPALRRLGVRAGASAFHMPRSDAADVSRRLQLSRFAALETLKLSLCDHETSPAILLAARALHAVRTLDLRLNDPERVSRSAAGVVRCISDEVARFPSLETLHVHGYQDYRNPMYDICPVLEGALHSPSLRVIVLLDMDLGKESRRTPQRYQDLASNNTVEEISLYSCALGAAGWSLLAGFRGLEKITFHRVQVAPHEIEHVTQCISSLKKLAKLSFDRDSEEEWVKKAILAAKSLTDLSVSVFASPYDDSLARALHPLQHIHALTRFKGTFFLDGDYDESQEESHSYIDDESQEESHSYIDDDDCAYAAGPHLEAWLSSNDVLECFHVVWATYEYDRTVAAIMLPYLVRGVRRNQSLTELVFRTAHCHMPEFRVCARTSGDIVKMLEDCNFTLQRLEGIEYDSSEHRHRVNHLLLLNRYCRDFAANARSVPVALWGDVLARISNADCNFFVTELVRRAVEEGPGQQRETSGVSSGQQQNPPSN